MIWDELLALSLPISMLIFGKDPIWTESMIKVLISWHFLLMYGGFAHHTIFLYHSKHEGAYIQSKSGKIENIDFGLYQLASTFDRLDLKNRSFLLLSNHTLHHFFPSLDHSILPHLHKDVYETCKEFENEIRELSFWDDSIEKSFNN